MNNDLFQLFTNMINSRGSVFSNFQDTDIEQLFQRVINSDVI